MDASQPVSTNVSDYLGMLRRHWWLMLLFTAAAVGGADLVTRAMPKLYESSTSVLVQPAGQDTNVVGGRTKGDINLDTEAQLVRSTAVAVGAAQLLRDDTPPDQLARDVVVEVPPNTSVLVITYGAGDPGRAQAGSHAFAEAYLRNRQASAQAELDTQITALSTKVRQLNATLLKINSRLSELPSDSPEKANLLSQRQTTGNQINNLAGTLNELTTATVRAGKIISDARLPTDPSKPDRRLNLATGLMVGLLAGLGVAGLRERFDQRIRQAVDVPRRAGVPVLAELNPRNAPRFDDVLPPYGPGGRIFNRLRNEVLAGLVPGAKVLVVTGASPGPASTLIAANLAAALARTGSDVILVGAHLPETMGDAASLARVLGVATAPGLSDVIAGQATLEEAAQYAARIPHLRVITPGGAVATGLMQSQPLRDTLAKLRGQAAYVLLEAPSTATSADAQSLANLADAAIVAVELRRTLRTQVIDADEQLRRVGTPLLGAVVLPRISSQPMATNAATPGRPAISLGPDGSVRLGGDSGRPQVGLTPRPADHAAPVRPADRIPPARPADRVPPARPADRTQPHPGERAQPHPGDRTQPHPGDRVPPTRPAEVAADVTAQLPRLTGAMQDPSMAETTVLRRIEPQESDTEPASRQGGATDGAGR